MLKELLTSTGKRIVKWRSDNKLPLLSAARRGDTNAVEELLRAETNPDSQDTNGETALHKAVRWRHPETAACLLLYGANCRVPDKKGRTPLSLDYTTIEMFHAIRQRHRRFKSKASPVRQAKSDKVAKWVSELEQNGILKIPGLVNPAQLEAMRTPFEKFIQRLDQKSARSEGRYEHYDQEEYWWEAERAYVCNNAFKDSLCLVHLCCSELIVETANCYLGRRTYISRVNAMRYPPSPESTTDMFGWHQDMEDKRLKMMILLTDVTEADQTMSYVLGSHVIYHPYKMFFKNVCSLEYCRKRLDKIRIFKTTGKAGDVFFFDSNGAHRGNRKLDAAVRDAIFIEYTTDKSDIWGGDIPIAAFDGMHPLDETNPFARMLQAEPKWYLPRTRKAPTWVENLPRIETWLES